MLTTQHPCYSNFVSICCTGAIYLHTRKMGRPGRFGDVMMMYLPPFVQTMANTLHMYMVHCIMCCAHRSKDSLVPRLRPAFQFWTLKHFSAYIQRWKAGWMEPGDEARSKECPSYQEECKSTKVYRSVCSCGPECTLFTVCCVTTVNVESSQLLL